MSDFNYRKFLTENKLTPLSKLLTEDEVVEDREQPTKFKPRSRFEDDSVLNSAQLMDAFEAPGGWDEGDIVDIHVEEEEKPYSWYGGFTLEFDGVSYEVNCQGTLEGYDHIIDFTDLEIESSEIIDPTPYEVDTRGPVKPRQLLPKELD